MKWTLNTWQMSPNAEGVVFWGLPDDEQLTAESPEEFLGEFTVDIWPADVPVDGIDICGYRRMKITRPDPTYMMELLLERLDEDYGDPEKPPTKPTDAMVAAAEALADTIAKEYVPWACDQAITVHVSREELLEYIDDE